MAKRSGSVVRSRLHFTCHSGGKPESVMPNVTDPSMLSASLHLGSNTPISSKRISVLKSEERSVDEESTRHTCPKVVIFGQIVSFSSIFLVGGRKLPPEYTNWGPLGGGRMPKKGVFWGSGAKMGDFGVQGAKSAKMGDFGRFGPGGPRGPWGPGGAPDPPDSSRVFRALNR